MAVTAQKGAPDAEKLIQGKFTLARFSRCEASAATPVATTDILGLQDWSFGEPDVGFSAEVFQQGGGDESTLIERGYIWSGTLSFLKGDAWDRLAEMRGVTFGASDDALLPMYRDNDYPEFIFEGIVRESNNNTHIGSVIIPDLILGHMGWDHPLDDSLFVIPFRTRRFPGLLTDGAEVVYDVWTGDGSTVAFTTSSTPLNLTTSSNYRLLDYDDFLYIKEKASTASTGTLQRTGYSLSGVTLTATTAPAAGTLVQALYVKAT